MLMSLASRCWSRGATSDSGLLRSVVLCANLLNLLTPRRALTGLEGSILKMCYGTHGGPRATSVLDDTDLRRVEKIVSGRGQMTIK